MIVDVLPAEYHRLLGYPPAHVLTDRARELEAWARAWYAQHGRPWIHTLHPHPVEVRGDDVLLAATRFTSARLAKTLRDSHAHSAIVAAVSAGPELERESQRLWAEEKPDEYFFLEIYGSAVVERLMTIAGAQLCAAAEPERMTVLPHYSPGYPDWDIAQQPALLELISAACPGAIEALTSGALRPRKSQLAVFGLTRHAAASRPLVEIVPCQTCTFAPCEFRRLPHTVNLKALKRWSEERLTLEPRADGGFDAVFRYEGTTCTNMGRPLCFDYRVRLGPRSEGYPICEQECAPARDDSGHRFMCAYIDHREALMSAIDAEKPLAGRPLHEVLSWRRAAQAPSCYCDEASRLHHWGLVLETIQYALTAREGKLT